MKTKTQLRVIIILLITIGLGAAIYKIQVLGFSLSPQAKVDTWTIEAKVTFTANGGPVTVRLNEADNTANMAVLNHESVGSDFKRQIETLEKGERNLVWSKDDAKGEQVLYYRVSAYRKDNSSHAKAIPAEDADASDIIFSGAAKEAAKLMVDRAKQQGKGTPLAVTQSIIKQLNLSDKAHLEMLRKNKSGTGSHLDLVRDMLTKAGVHAAKVKVLFLDDDNRKQKLSSLLEIFDGKSWQLIDPKTASVKTEDNYILWQTGEGATFEVEGGKNSSLSFSVNAGRMMAGRAAVMAGKNSGAALIDFSIYSLPLAEQNTFKLLLLIPLGALVVVILRNLVGIQTSGTFMPILIALTFLQTSLTWGLILFLVVVSVGLVMRSYLSHLNLLLVPRISAVLVFVIVIFVAISVFSIKMDFEQGLRVTFFPMIIISWTIERMSVLWEEEGPRDVLIQGGGSLFTACIIYLVMTNKFLGHLTYSFPELLLVLLAVILIIGSYSGYRLSELRRFEPMTKEH
ncbi:UUP1 family membrane protein [Verrucomicrobiaceae bacterium N1E253]|uniref:UUP1 family membrane protein n=1 Tax=Oceaniferula marina TaxID=2748318 RepID=A0A851GTI2_9BACT|nr:UUP1 family membrane protein [Oceaniferula marina]NWK57604.1 UUP1 family membrane protein [Oceaniferula marina]